MSTSKWVSFLIGFFTLFFIYHFPEFFSEFWITATFKVGFLLVAFLVAFVQGYKGLGGYGLGLKNKWGKHLLIGLLTGLGFFLIYFFSSVRLGYQELLSISSFDSILRNLPLILLMTAVPSIAEDILTRGYLYAHLGKILGPFTWMFLSSVVYVLNHIWRLNDGLAVLCYLFFLGLVLAYSVLMVKSLWLAFGIHWGANIALEVINSSVQVKPLGDGIADTYLLGAAWAVLFIFLLFLGIPKSKNAFLNLKGSF